MHQRTHRDDSATSDDRAVHDCGAGRHVDRRLDRAAQQRRVGTDERVIANPHRIVLITDSRRPQHGVLGDDDRLAHMHGGAFGVDHSSRHHPGVCADHDSPHDHGGRSNVGGWVDGWNDAPMADQHARSLPNVPPHAMRS